MNQFNIEHHWKFTRSFTDHSNAHVLFKCIVDWFQINNTLIYSHGLLNNVARYKHLFWFRVQYLSIAFVSCRVLCVSLHAHDTINVKSTTEINCN